MADQSRPRDDAARLFLLVLRCQAGDERAFASKVRSAMDARYLRRLVGDEAEDVQQEVWLTVYRHLHRLDNPRAFRTWLFQTTRHRAIDFLRARQRERELVEEAARDVEAATIPDDTLAALDESALGPALAELPAPQREVLLLRYQEDMNYGEIAVVAGCSIGTVRSRLHHARRRLQDALERRRA
jgi:RNA polymerase sigma-70 factor (ECF subfamily)